MNKRLQLSVLLITIVCFAHFVAAQIIVDSKSVAVPPFVRYQGVVTNRKDVSPGKHRITLMLYREQESQEPLWTETQDLNVDASGHFTAMLGSTRAEGVPTDLFANGEARWLAVQLEGQPEQPRTLLLS